VFSMLCCACAVARGRTLCGAVRCAHKGLEWIYRQARGHLVVVTFCIILNLIIRVSGVHAPCII